MFDINFNGVRHNVSFKHAQENGPEMAEVNAKRKRVPFKRFTTCAITNMETGETVYGVSFCSKKDQFSKIVGRKQSYQRAVCLLTASKTERIRLYKVYNDKTDTYTFFPLPE